MLLFSCFNQSTSNQDLYDTLAQEMCACLETKSIKSPDKMQPCYDELFAKNTTKLETYHKVSDILEIDMEEFGGKIAARLMNTCTYIPENFPSGVVGDQTKMSKQPNLSCDDLKEGKYYYLTQVPNSEARDTTFVTISGDTYLERMTYSGKDTYSLLKIAWKDSCKFELAFQESDDPVKKEMSKPGQIYKYEVMANHEKSFFMNAYWKNKVFLIELIKVK
jgi:hypothetical protein